MIKHLKRPVSILLCILMVAGLFTAVPFTVGATVDMDCLEYGYFYYRVLDNGNAQIAGFNTEAAQEDEEYDIVIPDTIDGHTVTGIEAETFSYAYLDSLTIPYTVTDISLYAFDAYSISKIRGYNGTAAETFCEQWASLFGFTFVPLGDAPASHTHTYGAPVWTWADDFSSATATFTCEDGDDTQTVTAEGDAITSEITTEATCTKDGAVTYTATVTGPDGEAYTNSKEETVAASSHSLTPLYDKEGNLVYYYCDNCGKAYEEETAETVVAEFTFVANTNRFAGLKLVGYSGTTETVVVPDTYKGVEVRSVGVVDGGYWAHSPFYRKDNVKTIIFGDNILNLKAFAVYNPRNLETIYIGKNLELTDATVVSVSSKSINVYIESANANAGSMFNNGSMSVTVYAPHEGKTAQTIRNGNYVKSFTFIGSDAHTYSDDSATWEWADYNTATATIKCGECNFTYTETVTPVFNADEKTYTATVEYEGRTYTDTKTAFDDGIGERLIGHSISLDGDIGVNFYMELSLDVIAHKDTAKMHFTIPTGSATTEQNVYVNEAKTVEADGKTYYIFKCNVAAKEIDSEIKAQIIDGDNKGTEYTYSVKEYADYLLAHTSDNEAYAKAAPLVRDMLTYGAYAKEYFDNTDTLENLGDVTIDIADPVLDELPEGTTFAGASLSLKSETTLSLYFKSNETLAFSCDSYNVETVQSGSYQIARIRGIKAKHIGDILTLNVNGGTIQYSPINYCKNVLADDTQNEKLQNVVKALYLYWQAADSYFD